MPLKVIGAGLDRTGTLSLKLALERLGLAKCYHMAEFFAAPEHMPLWLAAADGRPDWEVLFDGYQATVDYPGCTFWRELAEAYPDAKVLLSVRDPDTWFESTQASIFSEANLQRSLGSPFGASFERTVFEDFGERIHDRSFMIDYFRRRNDEIEAAIPAERLLVYQVSEGWGPLCAFLEVEAPDEPFPRVNTRDDFSAMMAADIGPDATHEEIAAIVREKLTQGAASS